MTLGTETAAEPHDAAAALPRDREPYGPMLGSEKRTRIYAVLAFAFRGGTGIDTALDIFEEACKRKNQEDKPLGIAVGQIREGIAAGQGLGDTLCRVLGRMLSVEEVAILKLLALQGVTDQDERAFHLHAMEMLLRLREIDLLEARRPQ
jgi:hypothetical protein